MFHFTSSLVGGLAAVTAWALVAQPFDTAKANIGADHEQHVNRVAKADRLAAPRTTPAPILVLHNLGAAPAIPVGCDPVASPIVEPELARVIGRCLS